MMSGMKNVLFVLLLAAPLASAQVYKWMDEKGRVHYGEKPPAGAKPSEVKPPDAQREAPARSLQSQELEFRQRQLIKGQQEERAAQEAAVNQSRCASARENLSLAERGRLYKLVNGERAFYSDAEQQAEVARRREAVQRYCS